MIAHHQSSQADVTLLVADRQTSRYLLFDNSMQMKGWTDIRSGEIRSPWNSEEIAGCRNLAFGGVHIVNPSVFPFRQNSVMTQNSRSHHSTHHHAKISGFAVLCPMSPIIGLISENRMRLRPLKILFENIGGKFRRGIDCGRAGFLFSATNAASAFSSSVDEEASKSKAISSSKVFQRQARSDSRNSSISGKSEVEEMNRNIPPPPLHNTIILNFGEIKNDDRAAISYWKLISPLISRVTPR